MKKLILIDGNAIIHRAFHAMPPFKTSKGELVNAVYGFASMLLNILNNEKPEYIAVSFDTKAKTFRHEEYDDYKATRTKAPDELYAQIPRIYDLVKIFEIPIYTMDGFEADDVLGTLATQAEKTPDLKTLIATGDHDAFQLVTEKVNVLMPYKGFSESVIFDSQKVFNKYGLKPTQVPDLKGLQGDSSDNIKGVKGVGAKTATALLQKYGSIENIYEHLDEITGKVHDNLAADKENAFFSKRLATIVKDVDVTLNLGNCQTHEYDHEKVLNFFQELEFKSLIRKLQNFDHYYSKMSSENEEKQASLF
jgi:DNA polymerase I